MGFGMMGSTIAECLAECGYDVLATEPNPQAVELGWEAIRRTQRLLIDAGDLTEEAASKARAGIHMVGSVADFGQADFVIETVNEDLTLKRRVVAEAEDAIADNVVIASNTSGLPITSIQQGMRNPRRMCGMHWGCPAPLSRLMEVTRGDKTAGEAVAICVQLAERCGKEPTILAKEKKGFIVNRLTYAVFREALALLAEEAADIESIDRAVRNDLGWSLSAAGIFKLMDIAGLEACRNVSSYLFQDLATDKRVPRILDELVAAGHLGVRSGKGFYDYPPPVAKEDLEVFEAFMLAGKRAADELRPLATGSGPRR